MTAMLYTGMVASGIQAADYELYTGMVASGIQAADYELFSATRASAYHGYRILMHACLEVGNVHCLRKNCL